VWAVGWDSHGQIASPPHGFEVCRIATPAYWIDRGRLRSNLSVLADVQARAGCKVLLALKGFAMWSVFPIVGEYLSGIAASSPHEARLGREELGKEVHAYAPAYSQADMAQSLTLAGHVVFDSLSQWRRLRALVERAVAAGGRVECGGRINPEHSEVAVPLYDPCAPGSRLGVTRDQLRTEEMEG